MVNQGISDRFLEDQLQPQLLPQAAAQPGVELKPRLQASYDQSYFFLSTFIEDNLRHHAAHF